jgi:hypothetical protein
MDAGDWIFLAQTIVVTLTGIVIFWYAWETQQLRKVTTRQAELVAEQLAMMRQSLQMHTDEQLRASKPFIRWRGGSSGPAIWVREFENEGGPIFNLSIRTDAEFLFDDDVVLFLRQTREIAWQARHCRRLSEHKQGDERTHLAKVGDDSFAWITEQYSANKITAVFNPYLGFANVRLKALPPLNLLWRKRSFRRNAP